MFVGASYQRTLSKNCARIPVVITSDHHAPMQIILWRCRSPSVHKTKTYCFFWTLGCETAPTVSGNSCRTSLSIRCDLKPTRARIAKWIRSPD